MAINPGSNINNTFDSLYNNKSSGKEERKKRQFKFILHQLELRINIYIYIHAELLADTNFPLIRTGLGQNSWLQIDQSVRILMSDSAPTYVCARARARAEIRSFERRIDTWRGCVTVAKGTTWLRPNGTARALSHPFQPHPSLSNPVTSTFHSTLSLRNISLPLLNFPLSLSLSLSRNVFPCRSSTKPHARRSIGNCLAALDNVQLT